MLAFIYFHLIQIFHLLVFAQQKIIREQRKIVSNRERLWSLPVHYHIAEQVDRKLVEQGLSTWEKVTCVTFIEVTNEQQQLADFNNKNILYFIANNECYSNIGYASAESRSISLSPNCATYGVLLHEIGHALGLWHEHNRMDRDRYIKIHYELIPPERLGDFRIKYWLTDYGVPYDYGSIMHYSTEAFSKNGQSTILPIDTNYAQTIGQRDQISFYDAALINRAYCGNRCKKAIFDASNCSNGGYISPIHCNQCICPTGFTGIKCERLRNNWNCSSSMLYATKHWKDLIWNGTARCTWIIKVE
ncbi:unnamed protein product [Thelazia callipaeda]|uniref:Metalloendopeptidase n=1 Tax=Thelazia callipaeda TaxID=103827 RepID=A0A0N5DBR1_THECL|nr:unnamed protein product [Thelazia callipaeda]